MILECAVFCVVLVAFKKHTFVGSLTTLRFLLHPCLCFFFKKKFNVCRSSFCLRDSISLDVLAAQHFYQTFFFFFHVQCCLYEPLILRSFQCCFLGRFVNLILSFDRQTGSWGGTDRRCDLGGFQWRVSRAGCGTWKLPCTKKGGVWRDRQVQPVHAIEHMPTAWQHNELLAKCFTRSATKDVCCHCRLKEWGMSFLFSCVTSRPVKDSKRVRKHRAKKKET